jgi:predicted Rdx family selenoprotein
MLDHLTVAWDPLLPWPALIALAALAAGVCALALWRRARGGLLRALFAAVILLALANPSAVSEQREPLRDVALVVVDESPSTRIDGRAEQQEAALAALTAELEALPDTEVRIARARGAPVGDPDADGGTRLFAAVDDVLSEVAQSRIGAVFLISDGQVHDAPTGLEQFALDAPVHLLRSGRTDERDRRLTLKNVPGYGIVGRELTLTLRVDDLPEAAGGQQRQASVRISRDGGEQQILRVPLGQDVDYSFEVERRGPTVLEIEAEPGQGELSLRNNRAAVVVNGVRDRLRVLLVSGEPHAGERAWRNILKSDPSVDLVHFTILRPPEKQDGTPIHELSLIAFPTRELFEVKLDEFDLVIFDRYRRRGVLPNLYLENISRYVEEGGALFEAAGPAFATPLSLYRTPLGRVLPATPSGEVVERPFHAGVTELGHKHPVTAELPGALPPGERGTPRWGRWYRQIDTDARDGDILMTGAEERPLLVLDRIGQGRVAQLTSDHIWLWSRGYDGGGPQAELTRRVAHWLMKEPDLEETDLRATVEGDRLEIEQRSLEEDWSTVEVTLPDGSTREVELQPTGPGRAGASLPIEEPGVYRVSDDERTALAAAGSVNPLEMADLRATDEKLAPLIEASDGRSQPLAAQPAVEVRKVRPDRDRHGDDWLGLVGQGEYVVTGVQTRPLLPELAALALALGALLFAWRREGR